MGKMGCLNNQLYLQGFCMNFRLDKWPNNNCVFFLFWMLLAWWKRTWKKIVSGLVSVKPLHNHLPLPHAPVCQLLALPSTFWSTHLPSLSGLKSDLPDSLWFVGRTQRKVPALPVGVVLRSTESRSVTLTPRHLDPLLRTTAWPSVGNYFQSGGH